MRRLDYDDYDRSTFMHILERNHFSPRVVSHQRPPRERQRSVVRRDRAAQRYSLLHHGQPLLPVHLHDHLLTSYQDMRSKQRGGCFWRTCMRLSGRRRVDSCETEKTTRSRGGGSTGLRAWTRLLDRRSGSSGSCCCCCQQIRNHEIKYGVADTKELPSTAGRHLFQLGGSVALGKKKTNSLHGICAWSPKIRRSGGVRTAWKSDVGEGDDSPDATARRYKPYQVYTRRTYIYQVYTRRTLSTL